MPLTNLNRNKFGMYSLTLPGTKADVSGFFRFFINDHEISSLQTQSASLSWGDLPLDFVDYIELYNGAFFWSKSRPNIVLVKQRLAQQGVVVPQKYEQFVEEFK
jgi:hypothetical protein